VLGVGGALDVLQCGGCGFGCDGHAFPSVCVPIRRGGVHVDVCGLQAADGTVERHVAVFAPDADLDAALANCRAVVEHP
jgi:hypothetical protein